MSDLVQALYENRLYPAMSHPLSDPAVTAVAALFGGLCTTQPSQARILEIGCCTGLNLIPLALRWPRSRLTGIDLAESAILKARELAAEANANNVDFFAADLQTYDPGPEPFDYIIAHGFYSWVPDEVKSALLRFCRHHLAPNGIATISFNLEAGWKARFPVIEKTRAILHAGAADLTSALVILRSVTDPESSELPIIDDMLAKGEDILLFDDFGPINDPWPLDRFVHAAETAGLRWLGESDPGQNLPTSLNDATLAQLRQLHPDPMSFQMAADTASQRTFRSGLLCRNDAPLEEKHSRERLIQTIALNLTGKPHEEFQPILAAIDSFKFTSQSINNESSTSIFPFQQVANLVLRKLRSGDLNLRIEAPPPAPSPPSKPDLGSFRLACAKRHLPLVDILHRPCSFPRPHYSLLALMDGTRTKDELATVSSKLCPELAFSPWLDHLAERGMFSPFRSS